jgi:transcriptional regulator with XRE-family HTH domain
MSFEDIASKMKARRERQGQSQEDTSYNFNESYLIRGKMVGVLLRDARLNARRTLEECARLLNVPSSQIETWEYGDSVPSLPQLELLAYYLNVPVSHFWGLETLNSSGNLEEKSQPEYLTLRNRMVGALLRQAREAAGVTIDDLAELCGLSASKISEYELGEAAPPIHELSVLASGVDKNLNYFLESTSQIGELLTRLEDWKHFSELPDDVREFAADPINIGFIHIAVMLSRMPTNQLREVGASILDITM